jgi:hypothetical protein
MGKETLQDGGLVLEKLPYVLCSLFAIARLTSQRKVTDTIRSTFSAWYDVFHLQGDILSATVGTLPVPLLQEILPYLVPIERPLLVLYSLDFRVLHGLSIKLDKLLTESIDGTTTHQTIDPGQSIGKTTFKGRGQPSLFL